MHCNQSLMRLKTIAMVGEQVHSIIYKICGCCWLRLCYWRENPPLIIPHHIRPPRALK